MKKSKAFTLIELIAILVILAIIALIVTPLVMNIVKKAKQSSNERSIDAYGKALEISVATYLLDKKEYPTSLEGLKIEYSGSEVTCEVKVLNEDGSIYLSKCSVAGVEVKNEKENDGYYHYGKQTEITYQEYNIGDMITYNGINFYVIAPSDKNLDYVTLLKEEPLSVDEVNKYGVDENGVNHINRYTDDSDGTAYDHNGYGLMQYYSSSSCRIVNGMWFDYGCTTNYLESEIKYVVDGWVIDKLDMNDLTEDSQGYKTRLISSEDLTKNLGYLKKDGATYLEANKENIPSWIYDSNYYYWTMIVGENPKDMLCYIETDGDVSQTSSYSGAAVRPVINLYKKTIKKN